MKRPGVFTAMDGVLLDDDFDAGIARITVRHLLEMKIPLVPISTMTVEELTPIADELSLRDPMIVECGGAIARWSDAGWQSESLGVTAEGALEFINQIEQRSGASLLVYSALTQSMAARVSKKRGAMLEASMRRRYSEPFVIDRGDPRRVVRAAAELGLAVVRGRRLFYLYRPVQQETAFDRIRDEVQCEITIGIGGRAVDAIFLTRCDVAIIVPGSRGNIDEALLERVPHALAAESPGPEGWSAAVVRVIQDLNEQQAPRATQRLQPSRASDKPERRLL